MSLRLLTLLVATALGAAEPVRVYHAARPGALEKTRALIAAGDETARQAFKKLVADADKALLVEPPSVTAKAKVPPSGDKHDYLSLAPYFWPDPSKPAGLPYLRKDGQVNPESRDEAANDTLRMRLLGKSVETLGLAYHLTKDERYAAHAARMLRVWFLAPETRMNPHLRYAQAVAGKNDGRGTGILESRYVGFAADAAGLLQDSAAWTESDRRQFDQWLGVFLDWLLTSAPGRDEAAAQNNHGTWFDVQAVQIALALGRHDVAKRILQDVPVKRYGVQIKADGRQPLELVRTTSFGYSCYNLEAHAMLANFGDHLGVDLWRARSGEGSFRVALDFLTPYLETPPARKWPYPQIKAEGAEEMLPVLRLAALAYRDPAYEALITGHADARGKRFQLLFPR
ncbi:MAG: hypothetical protein RL749_781 [Verrucomicrobiota bacterium]